MADRRKTERIFLRVPIRVRGVDQLGTPFTEETATVEINRDGARISLKSIPRFGTELEITNLTNNLTRQFIITNQCPQSYGALPEWGVEFAGAADDFWGVAFEEHRAEEEPAITALLCCKTCGRREMVNLSSSECEILQTNFALPRPCSPCGMVTTWEGVYGEEEASAAALPAPMASPGRAGVQAAESGPERRCARRLTLKVPLLVKDPNGAAEVTETEDISKTGLGFASGLELTSGDELQVTVGFGVTKSASARLCRVMWRKPREKSVRYRYGVQFVGTD